MTPNPPASPSRTLTAFEPCGHEPPQSAAQLHGVCIFCYRDRLADSRAECERVKASYQEIIDYVMGYFPIGMCYVNPIQAMNVVIERMQKAEHDAAQWKQRATQAAELLELIKQDKDSLRSQLAAARACIKDAAEASWSTDNDGTPRTKDSWERRYAEEIEAANAKE